MNLSIHTALVIQSIPDKYYDFLVSKQNIHYFQYQTSDRHYKVNLLKIQSPNILILGTVDVDGERYDLNGITIQNGKIKGACYLLRTPPNANPVILNDKNEVDLVSFPENRNV